jgi:ribosome-associated toxin RatA of RatAB toxin-antitoxin module
MRSSNTIDIRAPREKIFRFVSQLERWPEWLPHYRFVRVLQRNGERAIVNMGATRSGVPISWVSEYWTVPERCELHFRHLKAWTKGMDVVWTIEPEGDVCRVTIVHDQAFRVGFVAPLVEPLIGGLFIHHVAGQTLATFKRLIESQ